MTFCWVYIILSPISISMCNVCTEQPSGQCDGGHRHIAAMASALTSVDRRLYSLESELWVVVTRSGLA